ncbi:MAG: tyrosinase family protein [Anaerolineales bacterium]|nr:tyrosinase family protein [Anaerolineales bacterium]
MTIRYRRNINCLTQNQLHDLREAYQAIYDLPESSPDSFATLGGIHGLPLPDWCDHGAPGFLTWHRAYMRAFEKALQSVHCDVMLPFWDWSSGPTTGVPAACRNPTYINRSGNSVPNPLYSGPIASAAGGGNTSRRADIDATTFGDIATSAQSAMSSSSFSAFQSALNGPHGSVHGRTGGQMGSVARAGFDPIFYLHHCNVDRLWWNWQQSHPGIGVPASELTHELDPFNKPFTTNWQSGADVISTDDLGYRYMNWCFIIPPIIIWEVMAISFEPIILERFRDARLQIRTSRMPADSVEFRVFIGDERTVADNATEGNPAFAGTVGLFGMGEVSEKEMMTMKGNNFDIAVNLNDHLRTRCKHLLEMPGDTALNDSKRKKVSKKHAGSDDPGAAANLFLRVAAFDAQGRPIDPERLPVDDIELLID